MVDLGDQRLQACVHPTPRAAAARRRPQVEAVRQARLEAQQWRFQLECAQNELACKGTELTQLQAQLGSALAGQAAQQAAGATAQVHPHSCSGPGRLAVARW